MVLGAKHGREASYAYKHLIVSVLRNGRAGYGGCSNFLQKVYEKVS